MNPTLWVLVAIKIFIVFWLIYYIFESRKRKRSEDDFVVIEQGKVTVYAGAPVTHIPKDKNEYNQQLLYAAASSSNIPPPASFADPQLNINPK